MTTHQTQPQNYSLWQLFKLSLKDNHQRDYTQGSIGHAAFLLAIPMILEMAMESVFAVTDIFFVSFLGAEAVSIVGLTEAVITLLYAVAIGLSMAVTATIARRFGEKSNEKAFSVAGQTLIIGLFFGLLIGIPGFIYAKDILRFMGASFDVIEQGYSYTRIMLGGSTTILYLFLISAIFRGAGDATIAMRSLWIANSINIILDPLLIFGIGIFPEMGIEGAAVATNIGRGVGVLYQLYHLFGFKNRIQLNLSHLKPHLNTIQQLLKLSVGGILQFFIATASWVWLVRIVSTYGSDAVAGYTIAIRVIMFTILPAWGMSNAVATLVGQNLGAGLASRAEKSVWRIAKYNVIFMVTVAIIFLSLAPQIIGLFSTDVAVIQYGVECLRFIGLGFGFYGLGMVLVQAFNGAGDTLTPSKINFFCYWLFQIPLAYALAKYFELGPTGVFLAITISESIIALVGIIIFRQGKWKLKTV
ncbi:MATE family efflux transporter [Aliikangiella maris]|uniref:MATE family efflux transporter n=2 Tax=Aliikangiella maris TaxID=3162458 RepID=A0ABV2BQP8_9GAMM